MPKDLVIDDLSGGYNDTDPPTSLAANQCVSAVNIDFWKAPCGSRRNGSTSISLPATFAANNVDAIPFLHRHFPNTDETDVELWALGYDFTGTGYLAYKDTSWHDVTFPDAINTYPYIYQWNAVSLHGKLFIAMSTTGVDRLHVWDGTSLRRVGLAEPSAAPTSADTGVGTFSATRYYRTRETVQAGGVTILRSEPSSTLIDAPSGTGTGIIVTKPATTNSNATHWELEASLNNGDFYVIATTVIGTTTATDSTSSAVGYATTYELSEDIGDYEVPGTARYLLAADDRLIMAGRFGLPEFDSVVSWTPVGTDPTGVGNDERIPIDTDNSINLDGYSGGRITGMIGPINGVIYVFKQSHIYRMVKTGQRTRAYEASTLSTKVGALEGSIVEAVDERGNPAIYFIDSKVGPCRIGSGGLMTCGSDIITTFEDFNHDALVPAKALYYPKEKKLFWWFAGTGANSPSIMLVLQLDSTRVTPDGIRLGWSKWTGNIAAPVSVCLYSDNVDDNTDRSLDLRPLIGHNVTSTVYMLGSENDDDDGADFTATLVSRPFQASGSFTKNFGIRAAAIVGDADADAEVEINLIRDFGKETSSTVTLSFAPISTEDPVIAIADNLKMSESKVVQIQLTDGDNNDTQWAIQRIDLVPRTEQEA